MLTMQRGDITKLDVDAVVSAANDRLAGGGGVDGAIHRAAGPELLRACRAIGGCPTGDARITPGFELKAKWVIHAVGPIWYGGAQGERQHLASAYQRSLELAAEKKCASIAIPAISCGVYGFPIPEACAIATRTITEWLAANDMRIVLSVFDGDVHAAYKTLGVQEG
jgi:O-acetyl-ADP-ribose deacetylase (regulator of RNase III)